MSTRQVGTKYGFMIGLAYIAYHLILQITSLFQYPVWGYLGYIILAVGIYLALISWKKQNSMMTLKQGFLIGFWLIAVSCLITTVLIYLYMAAIDPAMVELAYEKELDKLIAKGASLEGAKKTLAKVKFLFTPLYISLLSFLGNILIGLFLGLVLSLIMQKKPTN